MSGGDPAPPVLSDDDRFMAAALGLGRRERGATWPNPAVGALVVAEVDGAPVVVGRGWTRAGGRPHGETEALAMAGARARGATLYVTLEPCSHHGRTPPCVDAIIAAGIGRIVSALEDPDPRVRGAGHAKLRAAGIATTLGVGAAAARRDHCGHISRVTRGRPFVQLKLALSADEKVAHAGGWPAAITGPAARDRVHRLRAEADAVVIGIGTAIADDPLLTCRLPGMEPRSPVRVVLDTALRLPPVSRLVQTARETPLWVVAGEGAPAEAEQALAAAGALVLRAPTRPDGRLDLGAVMGLLAGRGITRLLAEPGPRLAAALLDADLVDAALVFQAPAALGPDAVAAFARPTAAVLGEHGFGVRETAAVGIDSLTCYERG